MRSSTPNLIAQTHSLGHIWERAPVFSELNLSFPAGVSLVRGDELTGKTTLLRLLAGEVKPSTGWVEILGVRADEQPDTCASQVFRTDPQCETLDQISARTWFEQLPKRYPRFNAGQAQELAEAFDLMPHLHKPLYMLSAGSRRKVWFSAAFASGAALVLIDQPFAALDGPSVRLLREILQEMAQQPSRACVLADYEAPEGVPLAYTIDL